MTRRDVWDDLSRGEKLANTLYPTHATDEVRRAMDQRLWNEGRRGLAPLAPPVSPYARGAVSPLGGVATPTVRR